MKLPLNKQSFDKLFGEKLEVRRRQLLKTQDDVEHEAHIADRHLGKIERGQASSNVYTLYKLWKVLDLSADKIFEEIDKEMGSEKSK
ncbi:helix-turn-helix domain-containing protein [Oceanobacillus halophilus]|uniref:XRE family transcriptional regulator n=1 Tax=Oceanobacillus halophilus TaxID=930130 RepID=A0A495A7A5_9BACI|nr:helix-turn-helix transcriptional regulator [Oceanobacillus halophilus]RKQ34244.1 XRE family transcriptional regulator [Oceanobacillus halophilus]